MSFSAPLVRRFFEGKALQSADAAIAGGSGEFVAAGLAKSNHTTKTKEEPNAARPEP
jgi:hypothetical protein